MAEALLRQSLNVVSRQLRRATWQGGGICVDEVQSEDGQAIATLVGYTGIRSSVLFSSVLYQLHGLPDDCSEGTLSL